MFGPASPPDQRRTKQPAAQKDEGSWLWYDPGLGVVLVEALGTGLPVISTRCGGPEEIVEPSLGVLVEPENEDALAEAMVSMIGRSYSAGVLRDRVVSRYSFESVARQLLEVYTALGAGLTR